MIREVTLHCGFVKQGHGEAHRGAPTQVLPFSHHPCRRALEIEDELTALLSLPLIGPDPFPWQHCALRVEEAPCPELDHATRQHLAQKIATQRQHEKPRAKKGPIVGLVENPELHEEEEQSSAPDSPEGPAGVFVPLALLTRRADHSTEPHFIPAF